MDKGATVTGFTTLRFAGPYAQAAMPARHVIERGDWKQAMTLEPRPSQFPFTVALTHFARALGAARSGDAAAAEKDVQELARLRNALRAAKNEYWATEVEVSLLGAAAWTALPYREVIVRPYRFFYRAEGKTVWIVAVWHGAQRPARPRGLRG
jgi:plasmid stabilization system protein ParE